MFLADRVGWVGVTSSGLYGAVRVPQIHASKQAVTNIFPQRPILNSTTEEKRGNVRRSGGEDRCPGCGGAADLYFSASLRSWVGKCDNGVVLWNSSRDFFGSGRSWLRRLCLIDIAK